MSLVQSIMSFIQGKEETAAPKTVDLGAQPEKAALLHEPETPPTREGYMPDTPDAVRKAYADQMRSRSLKRRLLEAAKKSRDAGDMDDDKYDNHIDAFGTDDDRKARDKEKEGMYRRPLADKMIDAISGGESADAVAERAREKREKRKGDKEYAERHALAAQALRMYDAEKKKKGTK